MFRKHYGQLIDYLSVTSILPHLNAEGILTPVDREEIDGASTTTIKAQIGLMKIAATPNTCSTKPLCKLIKVMKCHANRALQELAFTMENDIFLSTCKLLVQCIGV